MLKRNNNRNWFCIGLLVGLFVAFGHIILTAGSGTASLLKELRATPRPTEPECLTPIQYENKRIKEREERWRRGDVSREEEEMEFDVFKHNFGGNPK